MKIGAVKTDDLKRMLQATVRTLGMDAAAVPVFKRELDRRRRREQGKAKNG